MVPSGSSHSDPVAASVDGCRGEATRVFLNMVRVKVGEKGVVRSRVRQWLCVLGPLCQTGLMWLC